MVLEAMRRGSAVRAVAWDQYDGGVLPSCARARIHRRLNSKPSPPSAIAAQQRGTDEGPTAADAGDRA